MTVYAPLQALKVNYGVNLLDNLISLSFALCVMPWGTFCLTFVLPIAC